MDGQDIEDDAIDTEALQSQIDLSMAFAQDLVSSWMKPMHKLPTRVQKDTDAELKEIMRRPPRLGVGTPIPEGMSMSRETARLKGQLMGKKRARDDEEIKEKQFDNDEESRAVAIKKKARVDPFGDTHGKKKKKEKAAVDDIAVTSVVGSSEEALQAKGTPGDIQNHSNGMTISSPRSSKKKRNKESAGPNETPFTIKSNVITSDASPATISSTIMNQSSHSECLNGTSTVSSEKTSTAPIASPIKTSNSATTTTDIHLSRMPSLQAVILEQPLLNLDGPLATDVDSGSEMKNNTMNTSVKKKRRRHKKKKGSLSVIPGDEYPTHSQALTSKAPVDSTNA